MPTAQEQRQEMIAARFRERFGAAPSRWVRAPGVVDLMGSHTDDSEGFVLTMPVGRDTWIAASPRQDRVVCVHSMNLGAATTFSLDALGKNPRQPWSNYFRGVASVLQGEGLPCTGFNGFIHSTLPLDSGLNSSAALACAAATLFEALGGRNLPPVQKATLCQRAENDFVGCPAGILGHYASCVAPEGCALLVDCRDLTSKPVKLAPGISVVICDTKWIAELAGPESAKRRAQCEEGTRRLGVKKLRELSTTDFEKRASELPGQVAGRCRFIIQENARAIEMATALSAPDRGAVRQLTADSFRGACDLYEMVARPMHAMMQAMLNAPGVVGARQAGAGFGGCMVAFVEREAVAAFAASVGAGYFNVTRIKPEIYDVEAAGGAGLVPVEPR
jgi:galactokinase